MLRWAGRAHGRTGGRGILGPGGDLWLQPDRFLLQLGGVKVILAESELMSRRLEAGGTRRELETWVTGLEGSYVEGDVPILPTCALERACSAQMTF